MRMPIVMLIAATLSVLSPLPIVAQTAPVKAEVRQDWTEMRASMVKIADAMPDDKFSFKSTPAQRNFGEQILHVATSNIAILKDVGNAQPPTINSKATA